MENKPANNNNEEKEPRPQENTSSGKHPHIEQIIKKEVRQVVHRELQFSGPIPPPEILDGYNKIVPGAAERILKMAEDQAKHRHSLEKKLVGTETRNSTFGLFFAFILVALLIIAGSLLIYFGKPIGGLATTITAIAAVVVSFIVQKKSDKPQPPSTPQKV